MYYTIYKITNSVNGKHYIGAHKTEDLDDSYMGSGKILSYAINKYGVDNFTKEILHIFDNSKEMFDMEKRIVNEEFVAQSDNYNLRVGGYGGFDYVNSEKCNNPTHSSSHLLRMTQLARTPEAIVKHRNALTSIDKVAASKKRSATLLERYGNDTSMFSTFNGRTHTKESKLKMSKSKQGLLVGEKNGQYGTMWIKNPQSKECSKIQKQDFSTWHQQGWVKGKYQNGAVYVRLIN